MQNKLTAEMLRPNSTVSPRSRSSPQPTEPVGRQDHRASIQGGRSAPGGAKLRRFPVFGGEQGASRETGKDSAGTVWWERTHNVAARPSVRQATYDGLFEETEVITLQEGRLFVIAPSDLGNRAMGRQPALRQALIREPIAVRLRAMPMLAPLNDSQVRRLATIAHVVEANGGSPCSSRRLARRPETWFWFIDWGQVSVTYPSGVPPKTPRVITAGNAFHNGPEALGQIPPTVAQALYRCKLVRVPFSEMLALARIPAIYARLQTAAHHRLSGNGCTLPGFERRAIADAPRQHHGLGTLSGRADRFTAGRPRQRAAHPPHERARPSFARPTPMARNALAITWRLAVSIAESSLFRRERHGTTVRAVRPDSVGSATGILTSPQGESDRAHASEPGAAWFRIRSEDLIYLLHSDPGFWKDTHLEQKVKAEKKKHRKYKWQGDEVLSYNGHRHVIVLLRSFLIHAAGRGHDPPQTHPAKLGHQSDYLDGSPGERYGGGAPDDLVRGRLPR